MEENYLQVPIMHTKAFPNELNLKYSYDMKEDFLETIDDQKHLPIEYYFSKEYSSNFTEEYISYVADYIRSFLKKYEYTLKPGATPKDKDFVNYFLLENKKGYCVHFASAATLMFRYYGIPARYVEGYHVSSNQYNDYNIADVLDSDAHAWVEVYSLRKGWYPIEVTVGYIADEPDAPDLPVRPNPDQPENPNRPNNTQPVTPDNPNLPKEPEKQSKIKIDWKIMFTMLLPVSIILVYFGIRMITLRRRYRRFNSDNRQEAVYAMATYLSIIDQKYPILNDSVIAIFEKNKFSNHLISDEEMIQVKEVIEKDVKELYSSLEFKQKIKFKYIKLWL